MRVSTDPWGVTTQPAGAFVERGLPRAGSSISICMSGTSARASASAMPGEAASLGSDIDRRQTLCPALMFSQHKRRIALFSRHGDFTQPIGKPDCHNTPSGRRSIEGGQNRHLWRHVWRGLGMIQAPHPNCRSGCGMHGHAFRCRVIGNSIIRSGQGFAPGKTCQPAMGGGRSKLPRKRCRRTCQLLCGAARFASALSPPLRLDLLRHPAPTPWPPDRTTRHAQPTAGGKIRCLLKAHHHHAPNRRTTSASSWPTQIRQIRPVNMNELLPDKPNRRQGQRIGSTMLTDRLSGLPDTTALPSANWPPDARQTPQHWQNHRFCRAHFMQPPRNSRDAATGRHQWPQSRWAASPPSAPAQTSELVPQTVNRQAALLCLIFFSRINLRP